MCAKVMPYTDPADLAVWRRCNRDKEKAHRDKYYATDYGKQMVAAQNAADNGVAKAIEARIGTIEEEGAPDETFDLALANISGLALERLAPALASVLKPRGRLTAGAFLGGTGDTPRGPLARALSGGEPLRAEGSRGL